MGDEKKDETKVVEDEPKTLDVAINVIKNMKATTVSKEEFNKLLDSNKKLIESIANGTANPPLAKTDAITSEIRLKRCADRNENMLKANGLEKIEMLIANHDDMKALGMNVKNVDENTVEELRKLVKEADGNYAKFKQLCATEIAQDDSIIQ